MRKNNKDGFTSIEIMVVLVISAILLIIFAVSRKSQIRAAYLREADVLITDIVNKERIVYATNESKFAPATSTNGYAHIGAGESVDARKYLYFKEFEVVNADTSTFIMRIFGKHGTEAQGVTVQMRYDNGQLIPILD